jgi:hypothetical protein
MALLLKESAVKLISWPSYAVFLKFPWLSFWEEETQKRPEPISSRWCQHKIFLSV